MKVALLVRRSKNYYLTGEFDEELRVGVIDKPVPSLISQWETIFPGLDYKEVRKEVVDIANVDEVGKTFDVYFPCYDPVEMFDKLSIGDIVYPVDDDDWIPLTIYDEIKKREGGKSDILAWKLLRCNILTKENFYMHPQKTDFRSGAYALRWPCPREYLLQHDKVRGDFAQLPLSTYPVNFKSIVSLSGIRYFQINPDNLSLQVPTQLPLVFYEKWVRWIELYYKIRESL